MRILTIATLAGALLAGAFGLQGTASASPLASAAMPQAKVQTALVDHVQYRDRRYYGGPRYYGPRYYGPRSYGRRYYGRPYRPAYGFYRSGPRVVCSTRIRTVRTGYGRVIRRPVEVCTRRW